MGILYILTFNVHILSIKAPLISESYLWWGITWDLVLICYPKSIYKKINKYQYKIKFNKINLRIDCIYFLFSYWMQSSNFIEPTMYI